VYLESEVRLDSACILAAADAAAEGPWSIAELVVSHNHCPVATAETVDLVREAKGAEEVHRYDIGQAKQSDSAHQASEVLEEGSQQAFLQAEMV